MKLSKKTMRRVHKFLNFIVALAMLIQPVGTPGLLRAIAADEPATEAPAPATDSEPAAVDNNDSVSSETGASEEGASETAESSGETAQESQNSEAADSSTNVETPGNTTPALTEQPADGAITPEADSIEVPATSPQDPTATVETTPATETLATPASEENGDLNTVVVNNVKAKSLDLDAIDPANVEETAMLATDKADYAPTDAAIITGTGFIPGQIYTLVISSKDTPPVTKNVTVTADENGQFVYAYQLDGKYRPDYKVEAKSDSGAVVAEVTFTDGPTVGVSVTTATGGSAISADTTGGTYTSLTGPVIAENASENIGTGDIILNAPSGFVFDTGGTTPTIRVNCTGGCLDNTHNINNTISGNSIAITSITTTQITKNIAQTTDSGVTNSLTWQNIRVRPTSGILPAAGNITNSGTATVSGTSSSTNFGTLTEVAGAFYAAAPKSTLDVDNLSAVANDVDQITAIITAKDQFENPLSGLSVNLLSTGTGDTFTTNPTTTNASGVATIAIKSTKAEHKTLSASVGGTTMIQTRGVDFYPSVVSTITVSPDTATVESSYTQAFTATSVDAFGNLISESYIWSVNPGTGTATINSSGVLTAVNPGTVTVTATGATTSDTSGTITIPVITSPIVTSAKVISSNQVTLVFNEPVNCVAGDFTNLEVWGTKTVDTISGSGTDTIVLTFSGGSVWTNATGTVDLGAGIVSVDTSTSLIPVTQAIADGQNPTASITYSNGGEVHAGQTQTIYAHFSEDMSSGTPVKIALAGANVVAATDMIRANSQEYYYDHWVGAGNGTVTVSFSVGTDTAGNPITVTPTSGATFGVDNTGPIIETPGFVSLRTDPGADGKASIGDTIRYTNGSVYVGDSDTWTVDLSAYGLSATAAPDVEYTIVADNDNDVAFSAIETVTDNGGNTDSDSVAISMFTNIDNVAPTQTISGIDISADTGTSDSDFLTKTASQTITATLSSSLGASDILYGSVNNGANWTDITSKVSGTAISWDSATLSGSSSIAFKITDSARNAGTTIDQSYVLDTTPPVITLNDGLSSFVVVYGSTFTDAGATTDDGSSVTIGGDTITSSSPVATYHVTYDAVDTAGNHATQVIRTVNVTKADATIVVTPYLVTYDGDPHSATGSATGVETTPADLSSLLHLDGTTHTNANTYATDAWTFDGNDNYKPASGTVTDIIARANATIVITNYNGIYDAAAHGVTGTATGVKGESLTGLDLGATYTDVPGGFPHITFTDLTGNYNSDATNASVNITQKEITIAATVGQSKVFGTADPVSFGFNPSEELLFSGKLGRTAGEDVGAYDYNLNDLSAGSNYSLTLIPDTFAITQASQTISFGTLADKTLGDPDFDVSATGGASGNPVTFTASNQCEIYPGTSTVHLDSKGVCTITAHQAGTTNYSAADDVTRTFNITDTIAPVISGTPSDITVEATSSAGAVVTWTSPTAIDNPDGSVTVTCVPTSGSTFPIGTTLVTCSATDSSINTSTTTFNVIVEDTTAPVITSETSADATMNSITITWTTNHPATSRVVYGTSAVSDVVSLLLGTPNYGYTNSTIEDATLTTDHSVVVSSLSPGTTYYLRAISHGSPEAFSSEIVGTTLGETTPPIVTFIPPTPINGYLGTSTSANIAVSSNEALKSATLQIFGAGNDFEDGLGDWVAVGPYVRVANDNAHSGSHSLLISDTNVICHTSYAYKQVTLPTSGEISLKAWIKLYTTDGIYWDQQRIWVQDVNTSETMDLLYAASTSDWNEVSYDLSSWAGRTVNVYLYVHDDCASDPTAMWIDNIRISGDTSEGEDVPMILAADGLSASYAWNSLADGVHTYRVLGTDLSDNERYTEIRNFTVDTTAPTTSADAGAYTFGTWTDQNVSVTLTCSDGVSGCDNTYWCYDDGSFVCTPGVGEGGIYNAPLGFTAEGHWYLRYYSDDNMGNDESVQVKEIMIDTTDTDGDGVNDPGDNCPTTANADQVDSDQDGVGDVCDNCALTINPNQQDDDGDDIGNACDQYYCIATDADEVCEDNIDSDCDGFGGSDQTEDTDCTNQCVDATTVLDEVEPDSLSSWTINNSGGNPAFSYSEITSPYDGSTALQTSANGNTVQYCANQDIHKTYNVSGNTSTSVLKAYLNFTSTMDEYNFPYVLVYLYDSQDTLVGYQYYYGNGVISGIYAGYAAADPAHYTELSAASGDVTLDLSKMGSDIDFSKVVVTLSNYACVGQNSLTFDHLRLQTDCDQGGDTELGSIHGVKWNDFDGDGYRDTCDDRIFASLFSDQEQDTCEPEPLLPGWTIFIDANDNGQLDGDETSMVTSDSQEHFGWYWFEDLLPGEYRICEVLQGGWSQTSPGNPGDPQCHTVTLPETNLELRQVSVNAVTGPEYNFGNQQAQTGTITISKHTNMSTDKKFSFLTSYGSDVELKNGGSNTSGALVPGSYTIKEKDNHEWWDLNDIACSDSAQNSTFVIDGRTATINLVAGANVTCVYNNKYHNHGEDGGGGSSESSDKTITGLLAGAPGAGTEGGTTDGTTPPAGGETTPGGQVEGAQTGQGGEVAGAETGCSEWPSWAWILLILAYLGISGFSSFNKYKEAGSIRWAWQAIALVVALFIWYSYDACRLHIWFPWLAVIGGVAMYALYLSMRKKAEPQVK